MFPSAFDTLIYRLRLAQTTSDPLEKNAMLKQAEKYLLLLEKAELDAQPVH